MRLSCRIRSGGTISWDVSGIPVTRESDKYQISVIETGDQLISQLTLTTDESDFVSYGCSAVNEMGSDYARIELVVNGNDCQYLIDNKITADVVETEFNEEFWYIIIGVLVILIIFALLGFCYILGRNKGVSNEELMKAANMRERAKENEYVKTQPPGNTCLSLVDTK